MSTELDVGDCQCRRAFDSPHASWCPEYRPAPTGNAQTDGWTEAMYGTELDVDAIRELAERIAQVFDERTESYVRARVRNRDIKALADAFPVLLAALDEAVGLLRDEVWTPIGITVEENRERSERRGASLAFLARFDGGQTDE